MRNIRKITAAVLFGLTTLLFLDFTGALHQGFGWLAKIQIVPAILAGSMTALIIMLLATLLFGRIYCSVVCPLGVMQDLISNLAGRRRGSGGRFRYAAAKSWLRYGLLALLLASALAGTSLLMSLLDPYAAYGRIASSLLVPAFRQGNNLLGWLAEHFDSYAFYSTEVGFQGAVVLGVAVLTLGLVGFLAWRGGRDYCNAVCPVGTLLGLLARFSLFRPTFAAHKCTRCGQCERVCKSSCLDSQSLMLDHSRCVACFNCLDKCKFGALTYGPRWRRLMEEGRGAAPGALRPGSQAVSAAAPEPVGAGPAIRPGAGMTRRSLLSLMAFMTLATAARAAEEAPKLHVDGGLADLADKKRPSRQTPLVPPGAESLRHLSRHCTACLLCVSACPHNVLSPSTRLASLMQPEMSYERGYCRPECTECSQVCPSGAIGGIDPAEKSAISIGGAVWVRENCLSYQGEVQCDSCERHCPTRAVSLVSRDRGDDKSPKIPVVDQGLCIGCGACEYYCPARSFSAIYVEGHVRHHKI